MILDVFCVAHRNFVLLLLEVPLPVMVMTTHELTTNDYLFMRVPVRVLLSTVYIL